MESEDQRKVGDEGENHLFSPPHLPRAWGVWDPQREPVWGWSDHRGPFPILSPFPCLPRSHSRAHCVTHAHAHTHTCTHMHTHTCMHTCTMLFSTSGPQHLCSFLPAVLFSRSCRSLFNNHCAFSEIFPD